ncbi:Permease, cytosine/purine, uracil, thiamine, allantoin [Penicillium digitatum]|nr:Permease, cytosine/purine, uracil, thiamine, allantoin [Penicillium digitatum]
MTAQILPYAVGFLLAWPVLTTTLRFHRLRKLHKQFAYLTRESMSKMTIEEAFQIQKQIAWLEFPFTFGKSFQFALFRTYGIPSISTLLVKTSQFSSPETSLKRYTDTRVLMQEVIGNNPTSARAHLGLARTHYLHSGYRASGKILDDDMLFTLALFALQPIRFINRYEWRQLTDLERCAIATFWKSVGDGLDISYEKLPSGKNGFRDGLQWLEEIDAWSEEYEARFMVPDNKNRETADQTTAVLAYTLPKIFHPAAFQVVSFMMDDRLRKAMYYDPPSAFYSALLSAILTARKLFLRYLALPRPYFLRATLFTEEPDQNNRFFLTQWDAAPYYVKPTFWNRWGPMAWLSWALGRPLPGDEGDKYYPTGYSIADVGPKQFERKGRKQMDEILLELKEHRTGKCPFH